jgi:membrane associated rhomboid family serine protease
MMYQQFRPNTFNVLPPVVKNLLIINGLFFLGTLVLEGRFGLNLTGILGLHWWNSELFRPYQLGTHIFMHGSFGHLFSNMFALWMFGSILENVWGGKKFLVYYLITALGAAIIHNLSLSFDIYNFSQSLDPETVELVKRQGGQLLREHKNYSDALLGRLNIAMNGPTVGASGAVFGVLLAFGMLFPNNDIYLFFAIPVKAKYFVAMYGIFELYQGISNNPGDNIAHFAHLGGMLFGYFLIKYWNRNTGNRF